ncbi:MAG TPA: type I-C CRISPR-associated protein Cas8c/Csd1 [Cytophagales bacterium]|jgi:CRISPR-associated protein Csd1|nr:type I-C CRISPR-associated protein Cas8c/Csd1 [Cytophagales bacterium]
MSWLQKLYESSEAIDRLQLKRDERPWPVAHMAKRAHVEVVLSIDGTFRRVRALNNDESITLIPVTEASGNRTNSDEPHPLCEELSYCAKDLPDKKSKRFELMFSLLDRWANSPEFSHPKVKAVRDYLNNDGKLCAELLKYNLLPFKTVNSKGKKLPVEDKKVFIRWRIEEQDNPCSGTWEDDSLIDAWIKFDESQNKPPSKSFCMLSTKNVRIAKGHHRFLRTSDDGAKLISSNDNDGFTFRGRFTDGKDNYGKQACTVGYLESQKAHNALRWLIRRQGYHKVEDEFVRCFVAWAVSCKPIPDPCANSWDFLGEELQTQDDTSSLIGDVGQSFAQRFKRKLAGYKANITDTEDIIVMGLDSATKGRMAITFYRELTGSEFLERIEKWHSDFAWLQNYGKDREDKGKKIIFVGTPAPKDIAWCAYGNKVEGKNGIKLLNATVERLMPSIIDGRPVPRDLVEQCIRHVSNRSSFKKEKNGTQPDFEKCLGIACSLVKGFYIERRYIMGLEEERSTRDYLYGRLLAVAEKIESMALFLADEPRETTAARLMQRFADRPYSTWRTIETSLTPYKARLNAKVRGLLNGYMELLDQINCKFNADDFVKDERLSGEFLLGYHCQRKWLNEHKREKGQWVPKTAEDKDDLENESNE